MGKIRTSKIELITLISEKVGYKAGLALNRERITEILAEEEDLQSGEDHSVVIVRSEEFDSMLQRVLYAVGNIPRPFIGYPTTTIFHKYRKTKSASVANDLLNIFPKFLEEAINETIAKGDGWDPSGGRGDPGRAPA